MVSTTPKDGLPPIQDDAAYEAALARINELWPKAEPGSEEMDLLDALVTIVEAYERAHSALDED